MSRIEFIFGGNKTLIQCEENEKIKDICNRFSTKIGKLSNDLLFVYNGNSLNHNLTELSFEQIANKIDKENCKMNLLVYEINKIENNTTIKPKEIICPECKESIRINIKDYKIKLFECKNGHNINMLLNEFEKTQFIDESKIKCDKCEAYK